MCVAVSQGHLSIHTMEGRPEDGPSAIAAVRVVRVSLLTLIRPVEVIMGANGLLDGSTKVPENQRNTAEYSPDEMSTKRRLKLCLYGEQGEGLIERGCVTTPY